MVGRRAFLRGSVIGGVGSLLASPVLGGNERELAGGGAVEYELSRDITARMFDGDMCWCHPRAGIVPGAGLNGGPRAVMTLSTLDLSGSDVFRGTFDQHTDDLGKTWTAPRKEDSLAPRFETIDGVKRPVSVSDFWPRWHAASRTLLGTGHTVVYTPEWKVTLPRPRHTAYSIYDPQSNQWASWKKLEMPSTEDFHDCGAGCTQRFDLEDGSILLPMYFRPLGKNSRVTVSQCTFDGEMLRYLRHGNVMNIDDDSRGFHEPSLTRHNGEYFLTIRNDNRGFVTRSKDGLHFEPVTAWRFDDGSELGSYNTQQHWVTHSGGLFLVYTRRGAGNDHVFRHRAPLFMAEVDPERLRVIGETERILVPERGARLGNFGVTDINKHETWVTVAEWMQPKGVEKYGSDGSVHVARIRWSKPNGLAL